MSLLLWRSCRVPGVGKCLQLLIVTLWTRTSTDIKTVFIFAPEICGRFGKLHSCCLSAGCWRMASTQAFGTPPNWIALVGTEGCWSLWKCKSRAGSKAVSASWCKFSWNVEHMIFDFVAMDVVRQEHQSLFARGRIALVGLFIQDTTELAAFVHDCC